MESLPSFAELVEKVLADRIKERETHQQRVQRLLEVLDEDERKELIRILDYYRNELALADNATDRLANPDNY